MASHAVKQLGPRKLGNKQIFLPNFTITLLRTPALPATFASFIVPLNLNKLDLRDYLWNGYGINVKGVRSYIQMQKLQQDRPGAIRVKPRKWFRPRSVKKMLIEMDKPFVWPEVPTDLELWDNTRYHAAQKDQQDNQNLNRPGAREQPTRERSTIAEQARALLSGGESWKQTPQKDEWVDVGEPEEVETDVKVTRSGVSKVETDGGEEVQRRDR